MKRICLRQILFEFQMLLLAGCQLFFKIFCPLLKNCLNLPTLLHLFCHFVLKIASFSLPF